VCARPLIVCVRARVRVHGYVLNPKP
jgi:hypothetical protein